MADDSIEIGITPDETAATASAGPANAEAAAQAAIPPQDFNADGSTPAGSPRALVVDSETADKIFDLLPMAHDATNWGYKNLADQAQRDAGARSVGATKHVFAHAYAIDPERAIKRWAEINGNPPSNDLIHAAQTLPLHSPKKALDNLTTDVEKASSQISKITAETRENELRKRKNSLTGPHGDAVARKKEYQSAIADNILPDRHDQADTGMFIFRAMLEANKTGAKVAQSIILGKREREMTKEMGSIDKELRVIETGKIKINGGQVPGLKQTIGTMGIDLAKKLKLVKPVDLAAAAQKGAQPAGPAAGVPINAASIAAQQSQSQGLGIGS